MNPGTTILRRSTSRSWPVWLSSRPVFVWLALGSVGLSLGAVVHTECPFRATTGWDCPACGGTRAVGNVLHGHPLTAIRDNAIALTIGVIVVVGLVPRIRSSRFGQKFISVISGRSVIFWVGLLVSWTVLRNLPGLTWLSPDR
jgi:hypothetical protein